MAEMTQKKNRTITNKYAFIGYGVSLLIGLVAGVVSGVLGYLALSEYLGALELPETVTVLFGYIPVVFAFYALYEALCVATVGCFITWMIAERPLADKEGYIALPEHCGMLLLLWGVWLPIWIYFSTKALNSKPCKQDKPVKQLLLCLFVPYYWIYWFYRQGARVDQLPTAKKQGKTSVLCLILAFLVPVAAGYIMQKRINERIG